MKGQGAPAQVEATLPTLRWTAGLIDRTLLEVSFGFPKFFNLGPGVLCLRSPTKRT